MIDQKGFRSLIQQPRVNREQAEDLAHKAGILSPLPEPDGWNGNSEYWRTERLVQWSETAKRSRAMLSASQRSGLSGAELLQQRGKREQALREARASVGRAREYARVKDTAVRSVEAALDDIYVYPEKLPPSLALVVTQKVRDEIASEQAQLKELLKFKREELEGAQRTLSKAEERLAQLQ